ncbi:MAG TPA: FAD-dependent oxidoreductase [Candidatus Paceibacterota bacterium]
MNKILILGGGFGGVRAALDLEKKFKWGKDVEISIIDKNESQTFSPALYEVASVYGIDHQHPYHTKIRGMVSIPYDKIFKNKKIKFVQAEIRHIDLAARHAVTSSGLVVGFDYLIIAMGSTVSTFGIPGADEYALKFKTIEDALMVSDKIQELYTQVAQSKRSLPVRILIGGAGFNGVELAAELSNCTGHVAHRQGIVQKTCSSITLFESGQKILPHILDKGRKIIEERLKKLGVTILNNSLIEEVGPDYVRTKKGDRIEGDIIIWSGGVKAIDLFKSIVGLKVDERGHILVNDFLQVEGYKNIFGVGDNIVFVDPKTSKPTPQMAFLAIEQGRVAAENITILMSGVHLLKKYKPAYNVWIAPVGGKYAVTYMGGLTFYGFIGYILRELADLRYFLSVLPLVQATRLFFAEIRAFSRND